MFDKLILYYASYFQEKKSYALLASSVCIKILNEKYILWAVKDKSCTPLENLTKEKKSEYWKISGQYYQEEDKRILACRAAYVLNLIIEL